ncbi:hypothetical protein [Bizionia gelidisalsuginis]|nr:hypothetical protein [Bizionia gelidisalsuginis]
MAQNYLGLYDDAIQGLGGWINKADKMECSEIIDFKNFNNILNIL